MAPVSLLFKFKTNLRALIKLTFTGSRRKPRRPPSPTASIILPGSSAQDATHSSDEKEYALVVNLDPAIWREILSYCEVIDIIRVGMTCRSLASIAEESWVWYSALLRISHQKRLPHLYFYIRSLSRTTLQQKAILSARLDRLSCKSFPYMTACISLSVSTIWSMSFLPGGEWLVVLCRFRGSIQEQVLLCKTSNPLGQPSAFAPVTNGHRSSMRIFTGNKGDLLLLLRSDSPDGPRTKLSVYLIHPSDDCPCMELVSTADAPDIENCTALGSYFVFGWLDHDDSDPKHYVKVMKFASCYHQLSEHCTMEVEWDIGKCPHSYGLRFTDSQITVVVSSTELIAAYTVPPLTSISSQCEPVTVTPFWRFSCAHMSPRAVYLAPSLPAVDTPSIIIFYANRYLFLAPNFDADPPDSHPTYFSTYTYPRSLKRPLLLGPHRAFWDLGGGRVGTRTLPTPLLPVVHEHDSWCTSGINTAEADLAQDVLPLVYAENYDRRVESAAWDEESGRLALCPRPDYRRDQTMTIFLVDMVSSS